MGGLSSDVAWLGFVLGVAAFMLVGGLAQGLTPAVVAGVVVGFGTTVLGDNIMERVSDRKKRRRQLAVAAEEGAKQEKQERQRAATQLNEAIGETQRIPREVVTFYSEAGRCVVNARDWLADARAHRGRSAYTPFWDAIENAIANLSSHRALLCKAEEDVNRYRAAVSRVRALAQEGTVAELGVMPGGLGDIAHLNAAEVIAADLRAVVYEAQTDYKYASIFEQRRTTAAIVAGFASLSDAILRMDEAIRASTASLSAALAAQAADLSSAVGQANLTLHSALSTHAVGGLGSEVRAINDNLAALLRSSR